MHQTSRQSERRFKLLSWWAVCAILLALTPTVSTTAQAASDPPPATPSKTATTTPIDRNAYPLADEIEIKRGNEVVKYRPLKTVKNAAGQEVVADRLIVAFKDEVSDKEKDEVHTEVKGLSRAKATSLGKLGVNSQLVDIGGADSLENAIQAYRKDSRVRYAEPDYIVKADGIPNDPQFSNQWGMQKIQAPAAWSLNPGTPSRFVAILDCGVYDYTSSTSAGHPDINNKVELRINYTTSTNGADDYCDHGTHVAGIAAANTNNNTGVAGVGYNTRLYNVKVLGDNGSGASSWINQGMYFAANNGASVINMSLGRTGTCSSSEQDAFNYAWSRNLVIAVAAGNDGANQISAPANCANALSVASTDSADARSSFSNYASNVGIAAPGSSILSTNYTGGYVYKSGTSMATPHVAGLAALVFAAGFSSNAAVVNRIKATADRIPGTGTYWANGRINALAAVSSVDVPVLLGANYAAGVNAELFVRGSDNAIWRNQTPWNNWTGLGGYLLSGPGISPTADGSTEMCALGGDTGIWCRRKVSGTWQGWYSLGGALTSAPGLALASNGVTELCAKGGDNGVWCRSKVGGAWQGWRSLGGIIVSSPALGQNSDGSLELCGKGGDNAIWCRHKSGNTWLGWYSLGGYVTSSPTLGQNADGSTELCVRGGDEGIWCRRMVGGTWQGWYGLGGRITSSPAFGRNANGTLELFIRGTDSAVWSNKKSTSGAWLGWGYVGGIVM